MKHSKIIKKALYYRLITAIVTFLVSFLFMGEFLTATKLFLVLESLHTLIYVGFEYNYGRFI